MNDGTEIESVRLVGGPANDQTLDVRVGMPSITIPAPPPLHLDDIAAGLFGPGGDPFGHSSFSARTYERTVVIGPDGLRIYRFREAKTTGSPGAPMWISRP